MLKLSCCSSRWILRRLSRLSSFSAFKGEVSCSLFRRFYQLEQKTRARIISFGKLELWLFKVLHFFCSF